IAMMVYYRVQPGTGLLLVPAIYVVIVMTALGVGTLLAALNVAYRDFRYVIPFLVQIWMFATPSVYMDVEGPVPSSASQSAIQPSSGDTSAQAASSPPRDAVSPVTKAALVLNPMSGLISAFRAAVLGGRIPWGKLASSSACSAALFV